MSSSSPESVIHQASPDPERIRVLGPYRIESLIPESAERHLTAYRVSIEPHQESAESYHRLAEELYYVLEGFGTAYLNDAPHPLSPGTFLRLPPGTRHRFVTEDAPLLMLDIHSPGSRPDRDVYFSGVPPEGFSAE